MNSERKLEMLTERTTESLTAVERIKQLDAERAKLIEDAKTDALGRAQQAVSDLNALGLPYALSDGAPRTKPKRAKRDLPPKYVNPADPSQTWSGRGRMAAWMQELIDAGKPKEDLLNPERNS